jgi:tetratricopeptide (TPR) repeat protein
LFKGCLFVQFGYFDSAINEFNIFLDKSKEAFFKHYVKSIIYYLNDDSENSLNEISLSIQLEPYFAGNYSLRSIITATQNPSQSISDIKKFESLSNDQGIIPTETISSTANTLMSFIYYENDNYSEALKYCLKALKDTPNQHSLFLGLGDIYREMNNYENSEYYFSQYIVSFPTFFNGYKERALLNLKFEKVNEAIRDFSYSITFNENDLESILKRSLLYFKKGYLDLANDDLNRACQNNTKDFDLWNEIAVSFSKLGGQSERIICSNKIIQFEPTNKNEVLIKGNAYLNLQIYEEAIKCYTLAIGLNVADYNAWNNRGVALMYLKRYDEAAYDFKRALEISPNLKESERNLRIINQQQLKSR